MFTNNPKYCIEIAEREEVVHFLFDKDTPLKDTLWLFLAVSILLAFFVLYTNPFIFMRKADIVSRIAEKTGVSKVDILVALESFFKEVKESLGTGEPVFVRGFGSFVLKKRAAKTGRNIKKNIPVAIPEHHIPYFKPAKEFVQAIKQSGVVPKAGFNSTEEGAD